MTENKVPEEILKVYDEHREVLSEEFLKLAKHNLSNVRG